MTLCKLNVSFGDCFVKWPCHDNLMPQSTLILHQAFSNLILADYYWGAHHRAMCESDEAATFNVSTAGGANDISSCNGCFEPTAVVAVWKLSLLPESQSLESFERTLEDCQTAGFHSRVLTPAHLFCVQGSYCARRKVMCIISFPMH